MSHIVTIQKPEVQYTNDITRITFPLGAPDGPFSLFYQIRGSTATPEAAAAVAAVLLPAMSRGWNIHTDQVISARMLAALSTIQDILCVWKPTLSRVTVTAPAIAAQGTSQEVGIFFSGGLDSFYSLIKHKDVINKAIFVTGFDISLENHELQQNVLTTLRNATQQLGKQLVEVETNVRQFADRYVSWDIYHGGALASVGLLLSSVLQTLYIPASDTYANLVPCGSHPMLDPLWSTEAMEIIHDGCEASRLQKAALVAQSDAALHSLRVCWKNPSSAYNCGRCEKCMRTMVNLYAAGALDRCTTFASPLEPSRIARMRMGGDTSAVAYWQENLSAIQQRGSHPALERALRAAVRYPNPFRRLFRFARHKYFPKPRALV